MKILKDSAIVLALATSLLYCMATAYLYGYCSVLNVFPNYIDFNTSQILFIGVVQCLPFAARKIMAPGVWLIVVALTIMIANYIWPKLLYFGNKLTRNTKDLFSFVPNNIKSLSFLVAEIIVLLLFLFFVMDEFYKTGKSEGKSRIDKLFTKAENTQLVSVKIEHKIRTGKILLGGVSRCVFIDKKTKEVHYIRFEDLIKNQNPFEVDNLSFISLTKRKINKPHTATQNGPAKKSRNRSQVV